MILGTWHTSLFLIFFISKLGIIFPGDLTHLFDPMRLLWERFGNEPCECESVGDGVTNDLPIVCELSVTFLYILGICFLFFSTR